VKRDLKDWCITKELVLDRKVEASNSCAITLIFDSFLLLPFVTFFFLSLFRFFDLACYCLFSFFYLVFLSPFVFSLFFDLVLYLFFFAHVVSSLAYPNLLGNKMIGCCCCCWAGLYLGVKQELIEKGVQTIKVAMQILEKKQPTPAPRPMLMDGEASDDDQDNGEDQVDHPRA
jgi:hypothetical protein